MKTSKITTGPAWLSLYELFEELLDQWDEQILLSDLTDYMWYCDTDIMQIGFFYVSRLDSFTLQI